MSGSKHFLISICIVALALHAHVVAAAPTGTTTLTRGSPHFDVTWVGGPTILLRFGDFTLMTDPTLGETFAMGDPNDPVDPQKIKAHRRLTALAHLELRDIDLVVLSHIHPDHFDEQAASILDHAMPIIAPAEDEAGVAAKGYSRVDGIQWHETREFAVGAGRVKITAVPARHSSDPAIARRLGTGNGYWIELSEGAWKRSLYWTGDSMPTDDVVAAVKLRGTPDLLVPHVGGVGATGPFGQISMRAADVVTLANQLRPKYVLPIHHSTYEFYREPIDELARQSARRPYRLDLIPAGSTVVYGE